MQNIYFTSDSHWGHANVLRYCNRPWDNIADHDEALIENWNDIVRPQDMIFHLGDFAFASPDRIARITRRLNGQKHLVLGNHDKAIRKDRELQKLFHWVGDYKEFRHDQTKLIMFHFPIESWNGRHHKNIHLHGHTHGSLDSPDSNRVDVGVDCWNYKPCSLEEIENLLKTRLVKDYFHHE